MVEGTVPCPFCGEPTPPNLGECPACGREFAPSGEAVAQEAPAGVGAPVARSAEDIEERLGRLERWREAGEQLGTDVVHPPEWVAARARKRPEEGWGPFLEEVESAALAQVVQRFEEWQREVLARLQRLEAYSIDGRLEREQVEDAVSAARAGEAGRALAVLQQVDRVVALKERHLALARQELERLSELLDDLSALGLPAPFEPKEVARDLEEELRSGRLAPLKQHLRGLRLDAIRSLKSSFPEYVSRVGHSLERGRARGVDVDWEIAELARCAKAYADGRPDEAVRRLRHLAETAPPPDGPAAGASAPTGASRTDARPR